MKTKIIFFLLIAIFLSTNKTYSQVIPKVKETSLSEKEKTIIEQHLEKYNTFSIDKEELISQLFGNGGKGTFRLIINEEL